METAFLNDLERLKANGFQEDEMHTLLSNLRGKQSKESETQWKDLKTWILNEFRCTLSFRTVRQFTLHVYSYALMKPEKEREKYVGEMCRCLLLDLLKKKKDICLTRRIATWFDGFFSRVCPAAEPPEYIPVAPKDV